MNNELLAREREPIERVRARLEALVLPAAVLQADRQAQRADRAGALSAQN
jgi:hypothetical protein